MKTLFIETKYEKKFLLPDNLINKLPKTIGLFSSIQFIDSLRGIKKQLNNNGIEVKLFKTRHTKYEGQLLGCNVEEFPGVKGYVYLGDGMFHPKALLMNNSLPVFVYDPISDKTIVLDQDDIESELKLKKRGLVFFNSKREIGVIITTKHGQNQLTRALKLKEQYPDKNFYFLVDDTFNFQSLENFPFIEMYVNSACPRIGYDDPDNFPRPVVNLDDIEQ